MKDEGRNSAWPFYTAYNPSQSWTNVTKPSSCKDLLLTLHQETVAKCRPQSSIFIFQTDPYYSTAARHRCAIIRQNRAVVERVSRPLHMSCLKEITPRG